MDVFDKMKQVGDDGFRRRIWCCSLFVVDDLAKAEWAMKKIAALQKDMRKRRSRLSEWRNTLHRWMLADERM